MNWVMNHFIVFKTNFIYFIKKVIEPHANITDPEDRYRSRMLNSLLVIFLPIALVLITFRWFVLPDDVTTTVIISTLGVLVVFAIFIVGRTGHYRASVYVTVILGYGIIYLNGVNSTPPHFEIAYLIFLPLLGIVLFTMREAFINYLIAISLMVLFLSTIGDIDRGTALDLMIFMLLTQGLIFFANYQRSRLDRNRQELAIEKDRSELIKQLIDNVSHDFKTPLSVIHTSLYLARRATTLEKREKSLIQIEKQAQRIESMIQDLLMMSKLSQGVPSLLKEVDLEQLIISVVKQRSPHADLKHICIEPHIDVENPRLMGVWDELERMILNLVDNAISYTPEDGTVTIRLTSLQVGCLSLQIIDTGIGISDEDLPYIFERFYRADKARSSQTGGTGLGLSIVKQIIERHQGSISINSIVGSGSTFCVVLPMLQQSMTIST